MQSFIFTFSALALLTMTKSLPCIGDSCARQSALYSEYDDEDGVFYIQEGSYNSASSNDYNNDKKGDNLDVQSAPLYEQQQQQQFRSRPRPSTAYQQRAGPNTPGQRSYHSNQQPYEPTTPYDEHQDHRPNPSRNNQGNNKSGNQGGNDNYYQNTGAGYNEHYPGSGNQGGDGGYYQNNGAWSNEHYPGSENQGGGGGNNQNNGGSYGRYPDRQSSCPNCYATDFGNGDYSKNIINIEK